MKSEALENTIATLLVCVAATVNAQSMLFPINTTSPFPVNMTSTDSADTSDGDDDSIDDVMDSINKVATFIVSIFTILGCVLACGYFCVPYRVDEKKDHEQKMLSFASTNQWDRVQSLILEFSNRCYHLLGKRSLNTDVVDVEGNTIYHHAGRLGAYDNILGLRNAVLGPVSGNDTHVVLAFNVNMLDIMNREGISSFGMALRYQNQGAIAYFIDQFDEQTLVDLLSRRVHRSTNLHHMAEYLRDEESIQKIFEGVSIYQIITLLSEKDKDLNTPIHLAILNNNQTFLADVFRRLRKAKVDFHHVVDDVSLENSRSQSYLHIALQTDTVSLGFFRILFDEYRLFPRAKTEDIFYEFCEFVPDVQNDFSGAHAYLREKLKIIGQFLFEERQGHFPEDFGSARNSQNDDITSEYDQVISDFSVPAGQGQADTVQARGAERKLRQCLVCSHV